MKKVTVKSIGVRNSEVAERSVIMEATLNSGVLTVSGRVPGRLSGVDMSVLRGDDAEEMFYVLAGSPQSTYSRTSYLGTDKEDIINYLKSAFPEKDLLLINPTFSHSLGV